MRRARRGVRAALLLALLTAPAAAETVPVAGLAAPVEIVTDRWGVPHISAASQEDAFFGQGYAAAANRLWQMDGARRRLLGQLAAAIGPAGLPFDIAARTVLFRGDVAAEWARQHPRAGQLGRAWIRGVNARIAEVLANTALLPPEFVALDMRPDFWREDDLILMRGSLAPNVRAEVRRAVLACQGALSLDALAMPLEPAHALAVPPGLEPCLVKPEQLALFERLSAPTPDPRSRQRSELGPVGTAVALADDLDQRQGSNAWVIAPARTGTGRALLASDPHLALRVPGPSFIAHLRAPGLDAVGAGWVFRPGFQFGHNDHSAHARTDFQIDQEDLYVLALNPEGTAYRTPGGWAPITRSAERIAVRGAPDAEVTVATTPLGPVIFEDRAAGHALVWRSAHLQPGPSVALEYVGVTLARSWAEYREALRFAAWGSNYMFADVEGNIGWQTAGRAPRRRNHDGLLPVPAAGDYPWDGMLPLEEMVGAFNPPEGWLATANQMPFPSGWPEARITSWEWIPDDRYRRVSQVLAAQDPHGPNEAAALQLDVLSLRAQALLALLPALPAPPAEAALLRGWDARLEAGSEAATLFALWWAELAGGLRLAVVPEPLRAALPLLHPHVVLALASGEDARLGERRLVLLGEALERAATRFRALPANARRWGDLHQVELRHPVLPEAHILGGRSGGDSYTVMARWWANAAAPVVLGGASFRAVLDIGNWDATRAINLPGQSGDPRSPHFRDLFPLWIAGESFPLAHSPAAVAAVAESTLTLLPAPAAAR